QVFEGFGEKATGAGGRIEDDFAESRVDHRDNELHECSRRVELAILPGGVAHLLEHGFVKMAEGVNLVGGGEVDAVDLVEHVAQQVTVEHPVNRALEDGADHIAAVATSGTGEGAKVGEQAGTFLAVRQDSFFLIYEGDE